MTLPLQVGETLSVLARAPQQRLLVVEDEWPVAVDIANALQSAGAIVVGPVPTVAEAIDLINADGKLDGAVLDINLRGECAYSVADALSVRKIPTLLATGYGENLIPAQYRDLPRCQKPFEASDIVRHIAALTAPRSAPSQERVNANEILGELSSSTFEKIAPFLEILRLPKRATLRSDSCYFLTSGLAVCTITNRMRDSVDIGLIGREGFAGVQSQPEARARRVKYSMLLEGEVARIDALELVRIAGMHRYLHRHLQQFSDAFMDQVAANFLSNARYTVTERVARWLLVMSDKTRELNLDITHDEIAFGLRMRRASATAAINYLGRMGCITHGRGEIELVHRAELIKASGGCYP